ncbi:MAG TPA: hypothetical protein VLU25_05550 [Acidobacteriota bacterium]|nr:hypothetical protein [Acidobacteriota bacterium]
MDLSQIRGLDEPIRLHDSQSRPKQLLETSSGAYAAVSPDVVRLLRKLRAGQTYAEIAEEVSRSSGSKVEESQVREAADKVFRQLRAIEDKEVAPPGFLFRLPLLSAPVVRSISSRLTFLFHPLVALACLMLIGAALWGSVQPYRIHQIFEIPMTASNFWKGFLILLLTMVIHEFGHASASIRYGAKPSEIGFTLFLIFPAFYSDVTSSWELPRLRRVIVDVSGLYFQLICGSLLLFAYLQWGWEPLWVAWILILGSALFMLNPILRFDGYWMIADALGVANLRAQTRRIALHLWNRLRSRPVKPLPWPPHVLVGISLYSAMAVAAWVYFLTFIVPLVGAYLAKYPEVVLKFWNDLMGDSPVVDIQPILVSTYLTLALTLLTYRIIRWLTTTLVQTVRARWMTQGGMEKA